ncbi:MAG: hypothetical protein Q7K40_04850 [bacterium]|nr:hypothetical protein [bacterium]
MNSKEILKSEGFANVYEWHDEPNVEYSKHEHKGKVTIFVIKGDVTFIFKNGEEKIICSGERLDVPIGIEHSAIIGPKGCDYVVGEMIKGDS